MKKIVIIEDEKPNSDELQNMLRRMYPDYDVETVLRTVKSVRNYFSEGIWPDLVFSDIQLTDGVVFDAFSDESISLRIVFLTAYDNYVMQALEYNCVQYLLKPIDEISLRKVMEKAEATDPIRLAEIKKSFDEDTTYKGRLMLPTKTGFKFKRGEELVLIKLSDGEVRVYCSDGEVFAVDMRLESFERILIGSNFIRVNRQTIVNMDYLDRLESAFGRRYTMKMNVHNDISISVSKEKMADLRKRLANK